MEFPDGELVWWRGGTNGTGSAPHGAIRIILYTIYITPYIKYIYSPATIANAQPREPSWFAPTYRSRCYINIIILLRRSKKIFVRRSRADQIRYRPDFFLLKHFIPDQNHIMDVRLLFLLRLFPLFELFVLYIDEFRGIFAFDYIIIIGMCKIIFYDEGGIKVCG